MKSIFHSFILSLAAILGACSSSSSSNASVSRAGNIAALQDSLQTIVSTYPGEIGIAIITDGADTILVNDTDKYPLMSVFKLHQAIALCDSLDRNGLPLDSVLSIPRAELNPDTWSPMLKDIPDDTIRISVRDMLRYTLTQSDNNASNYMFAHLRSVSSTDSLTATLIPRSTFHLAVSEAEMWSDHKRCYENHSSPLGAALLINRLFTDSIAAPQSREFICTTLGECKTGTDRIVAPLIGKDGVKVAHKTGSGFRSPDGVLSAHNDVAFITLPDGHHYSLAVLVKDFHGSEEEAAKAISHISRVVYETLTATPTNQP